MHLHVRSKDLESSLTRPSTGRTTKFKSTTLRNRFWKPAPLLKSTQTDLSNDAKIESFRCVTRSHAPLDFLTILPHASRSLTRLMCPFSLYPCHISNITSPALTHGLTHGLPNQIQFNPF